MKQEQANINQIRTALEKMQSRADLLHLLNEVNPLIYGEKAVPFELKQITWYANPKLSGKYCLGKTPMQTWRESIHLAKEKLLDTLNENFISLPLSGEVETGSAGEQPGSNNLTDWNGQEGIKTPSYPSTILGVYVSENPKTNH